MENWSYIFCTDQSRLFLALISLGHGGGGLCCVVLGFGWVGLGWDGGGGLSVYCFKNVLPGDFPNSFDH